MTSWVKGWKLIFTCVTFVHLPLSYYSLFTCSSLCLLSFVLLPAFVDMEMVTTPHALQSRSFVPHVVWLQSFSALF